ncbi:hypothetical protein SAMN04515674_106151 [Pseudarcicella hirudinis]|uniref:Uncharacterized protein n=1 Tax=Pseudarcicella hirudinis TaxID=1079859 RepID=A0A1I5TQ75_9BACT|nr:hypothetical protein [Pseudarcicella hirudinis]SFP85214.1 hypothetical protein SAMN04515674_106151 [Pseudarcicella hirudinis]
MARGKSLITGTAGFVILVIAITTSNEYIKYGLLTFAGAIFLYEILSDLGVIKFKDRR